MIETICADNGFLGGSVGRKPINKAKAFKISGEVRATAAAVATSPLEEVKE